MTFLILSDIHHAQKELEKLISQSIHLIDGIIFAGDGLETLKKLHLQIPIYSVKGNMDHIDHPTFCDFYIHSIHIAITHGHLYDVKQNLSFLKRKMVSEKYDLVIFGHTHSPYQEKIGNTFFFNPGAFQKGEYGLLTIEENDFYLSFEEVN